MSEFNPYEAPSATQSMDSSPKIEHVAEGQKMIVYAILVQVTCFILQIVVHPILGVFALFGAVLSIVGVFRLASGLGFSIGMKLAFVLFMFIPCLNLIILLALNSRATEALRGAGYKVGLLGASK